MALFGYVRKRFGSRLYKPMISEEKKYALRAAEIYRDEGYFAKVLPDEKRKGQFMVWRSVNPRIIKKKKR